MVVRDDNSTPTNPADDFNAIYVSGDVNGNGKLDYGEIWLFTSTGATATPLKLGIGLFTNTATVTATNGTPVSASDVANVTGKQEGIQIVKAINAFDPAHPDYFEDANTVPGQYLTDGTPVTFTFAVSIVDGLVPVANVVVTDSPAMTIAPILQANGKNIGDTNSNGLLDFGEIWIFRATGTVLDGLHTDVGTVTGTDTVSGATLTKSDPANYTGQVIGGIHIVKAINAVDAKSPTTAEDANDPSHPVVLQAGASVVWTYVVTNTSGVTLSGVKVVDDNGTPNDPTDDIVLTVPTSGDNNNGLLDKNETWIFTAPARTAVAGLYTNVATAQGTSKGTTYFDNDPATYFGWFVRLEIQKATNALNPNNPTPLEDGNTAPGQILPIGTAIVWTYRVFNAGNIAVAITVTDDFGTASNPADDFSPTYVSGDANGDHLIDPNEVWLFTSAGARSYAVKAGQYVNVARVSAMAPDGSLVTDTDRSNHFGATATLTIQKAVNAVDPWNPTAYEDADYAPGVVLPIGSTVTWTYLVANTSTGAGAVAIDLTSVTDDGGITGSIAFLPMSVNTLDAAYNDGDRNHNNLLDPGEVWLFRATGTVPVLPYMNTATANGVFRVGGRPFMTSATDVANILGTGPGINVIKLANGQDANSPAAAVFVPAGSTVTWTYLVTATTSTPLSGVFLTDVTLPGLVLTFVGGDTNNNNVLELGETWTYTASSAAPVGLFGNVALASGAALGCTSGNCTVYDDDLAYVFGVVPKIAIVKAVNALDPLNPTAIERADGVTPELLVGANVTFTYLVTNTGNIRLAVNKLTGVVDDGGTPGTTADDFFGSYVSGDTNNDGFLDLGEVWLFKSATMIVKSTSYTNVAKVTGFEPKTVQTVTAQDTAAYLGRAGAEGLTPGFWKNNADNKNAIAWPRNPDGTLVWYPGQAVSSMFSALITVGSPYADLSLEDALGLGGGGIEALLRHGIAAVLGATSPFVAYPWTAAETIAAVNAAILAGDSNGIQNLKDKLEGFNKREADLDANGIIPTPSASISGGIAVTEGNSGSTAVTITVTLSGQAQTTVTMTWKSVDGSATAASGDYTGGTGTLTFLPGQTVKTIAVFVNGDTTFESNETFSIQISGATGASIGASSTTVTIVNDESGAADVVDLERLGHRGQRRHDRGDLHHHAVVRADGARHSRVEHGRRHGDRGVGRLRGRGGRGLVRSGPDVADDHGHGERRHALRAERDVHGHAVESARRHDHHRHGHRHHRQRRRQAHDHPHRNELERRRAGQGADRVHHHPRRQPHRSADREPRLVRHRGMGNRLRGDRQQRRDARGKRLDAASPRRRRLGDAHRHAVRRPRGRERRDRHPHGRHEQLVHDRRRHLADRHDRRQRQADGERRQPGEARGQRRNRDAHVVRRDRDAVGAGAVCDHGDARHGGDTDSAARGHDCRHRRGDADHDRADYQSATFTITFAAGQTSATVTVKVVGDKTKESNEVFNVNVTNPGSAHRRHATARSRS